MLKRIVIFSLLLVLGGVIYVQGAGLSLAYLVFFPILLFPLFYFYFDFVESRWFYWGSLAVVCLSFGFGIYRHGSHEIGVLGAEFILLFGGLVLYRRVWVKELQVEEGQDLGARQELQTLKEKYQTRLESLHRLEKQVSSLMELFEIARDFSESLTYESMARILREELLPQLPFQKMRFILADSTDRLHPFSRQFIIEDAGVRETLAEFSAEEMKNFQAVMETRQMVREKSEGSSARPESQSGGESWIFPMPIDGHVAALLTVEGAQQEDFVRFEVLVSHLVLQVKKIGLYETVKELSIIDGLTGVYVRRHFLERFKEEVQRSLKFKLPFAVLMLDIDHFKRYNDQFGHLVGDATLKEVASVLRQNLRKVDIVARYGGEEFVAVLPETTREAAADVAERIRSNIARHSFRVYDVKAQVTVSLGIASFPEDLSPEKQVSYYPDLEFDLIRFADKALYRAKEEGRNRVYRYSEL